MKTLYQLNHLLNLNYDEILDPQLMLNAYLHIQLLADNIESTWETYKDKGYYIDEESFNLLNDVLGKLDELGKKIMTNDEFVKEYYYYDEDDEY